MKNLLRKILILGTLSLAGFISGCDETKDVVVCKGKIKHTNAGFVITHHVVRRGPDTYSLEIYDPNGNCRLKVKPFGIYGTNIDTQRGKISLRENKVLEQEVYKP